MLRKGYFRSTITTEYKVPLLLLHPQSITGNKADKHTQFSVI